MKFLEMKTPKGSPARISFRIFNRPIIVLGLVLIFESGCSLFITRPVQDMSDTLAAIRAAKEVQADTLAVELFRQSNEFFFNAKREYRYKNFQRAKEFAIKARHLAERAEFEALHNGGNRTELVSPPDPLAMSDVTTHPPAPSATPSPEYSYPASASGVSAETYEQNKAAEANKKAVVPPAAVPTPAVGTIVPPVPGP